MKRRSHAKQRDLNEPVIVEALRKLGAKVYLLDGPVDLLVGWRGSTCLLEVKRGDKIPAHRPLTTLEAAFFRDWDGGARAVVRCVREALCVVGAQPCLFPCGCGSIDDPAWFTEEREREQAAKRAVRRRLAPTK